MASNMKAVKAAYQECTEYHADYQGHGACSILQTA